MRKKYELIPDIVEDIADMLGIYGVGDDPPGPDGYPLSPVSHSMKCNCRLCFTTTLNSRIRDAISREPKMGFINSLREQHEN